jgi:hypothetical protein
VTTATVQDEVVRTLASLGDSSIAIARTLANKGVKGVQRKGGQCALAVYIAEQFPELYDFQVSLESASTLDWWIPLTPAQQNFTFFFDAGAFPDLVAS